MPPATDAARAPARLRTRDAIALGLLHGPAELLPVSSSAHVTLVPWLLGWPYAELDGELRKAFEVALHAGTVAALLVGLRDEVAAELRALDRRRVRRLVLSTLPPAVAGLALRGVVARRAGTPGAIANGLAGGAVAMAVADVLGPRARRRDDATNLDALLLGLAQACALLPGISRSGATLAVARARGFAPADASLLSRDAALPVIAGATGLEGLLVLRRGLPAGAARGFAAGTAASFAGTLAVLRVAGRDRSLLPWAAYRIALAVLVRGCLRARRGGSRRPSDEIHPASDVSPPDTAAQ